MTSASIVPMVAVATPRITVFLTASWADDNSVNTNTMLCSVMVDGVTSVVAFGENAALSNAKYGRNTGLSSTNRQNISATQRQRPSSIERGAPYLPPTTEKPRRPSRNFWPRSSRIVSNSSGTAAAAASSSFGGYWNRLQIFVVMVWKPAGSARIAGEPNSVIACRNAISAPAASAGNARGLVTRGAVVHALPPRMAEASSSSPGMLSSALATSTKTNGNV